MWWYYEVGPLGGDQVMRVEPSWMRLVPLKRCPGEHHCPLCHVRIHEATGVYEPGSRLSPDIESAYAWFGTSQLTVRKKSLMFKLPCLYGGVLLLLLLSRFSDVRLCATPWTAAHQAPSSMGFSRQGYWSGLPLLSPAVCYSHPNELRYPWMIPRNTHHHIGLPIPCTLELLPQGNNLKPLYISILFLGCLGLYPTIHLSTYEITYGQDYSFQHCLTL